MSMETQSWLEITVEADGNPEAVCARLEALGFEGFEIRDETEYGRILEENRRCWDYVDEELYRRISGLSQVRFWLEQDEAAPRRLASLREVFPTAECRTVRSEDWENSWQKNYPPVLIGERLAVVPVWEERPAERCCVVLDPGLLFGTGTHPTTRLCLEAAEELTRDGDRVLDLGCGSGILGIAALVLGADAVTAVDIDEKARQVVPANAALSGEERNLMVLTGDVVSDSRLRDRLGGGWNLIFANIVADVIIRLAPYLPAMLAPGGHAVVSGILDGRQDETRAALEAAGLTVLRHDALEEWHAFVCSH